MISRTFICATLAASISLTVSPGRGIGQTNPFGNSKAGVTINDAKAFQGYTLIAPMLSSNAFLIDMDGKVVHTWETSGHPALSTYLLDNGHLLRTGVLGKGGVRAPGVGGRIQEYTWNGELVWDFTFSTKDQFAHHDIARLPNGNVLMIVAERKTVQEVVAAGGRPESIKDVLHVDAILEVRPTGKTSGEVVWEWRAWDHLIQDHDKTRENFGKVSAHPERIDLNYHPGSFGKMVASKHDLDKLKGLGYLGGADTKDASFTPSADWTHFNSIDYNADLDQIAITVFGFGEFWIIDHSTTKSQSASSGGGRYGKGGDLLYRWGNPQAYRAGTNASQRLFVPHNAYWIPKGLSGAGNMLVFNNGANRPNGSFSSVDEVVLPVRKDGAYDQKPGLPFGPSKVSWTYHAPTKADFFAPILSGAQRLPNGNTLVCWGPKGTVFEVTMRNEIVWMFQNRESFAKPLPPGVGGPKATPDGAVAHPMNAIFRCYRFGYDHPAVKGRKMNVDTK